ncbi:trypsin-like peptidase domain-containing protein [Dissulfurirhabdus thermomarina]|uniref:Trypsin-like peptidase domain-containing protein n=1 Tax=Dissulfurirhabdus thermomarina TaxID=1765737 RepID=A0A6N9TJN5_DISTH|nr:serine protease [Dissulfurirhabdus thermomarina]NDY41298.1 trypsin-like peptidase domain-containing protein [Dissulfurirhabdus thermomarina]NMX23755.1 trypsin-like peptidase domain-containing protein [Dissulfurirhabdus thermomarina]
MRRRRCLFAAVAWMLAAPALAAAFPAEAVYERCAPKVVAVWCTSGSAKGVIGAGSIVAPGRVLTNAHVVFVAGTGRPYPRIRVYLKPDRLTGDVRRDLRRPLAARVAAADPALDIALLEVEGLPAGRGTIPLAPPGEIHVGEEVVAIGHPEQGGFWSLTYGRLSGAFMDFRGVAGKHMYQTDTSVNRGNSGGPLLDAEGRMVGMNTSIARKGAGGVAITGVNFALQSRVVHDWLAGRGLRLAYAAGGEGAARPPRIAGGAKPTREAPGAPASPRSGSGVRTARRPPVRSGPPPVTGEAAANATAPARPFLTPARPYDYDDLTRVEAELEEMMHEMRGRIRH